MKLRPHWPQKVPLLLFVYGGIATTLLFIAIFLFSQEYKAKLRIAKDRDNAKARAADEWRKFPCRFVGGGSLAPLNAGAFNMALSSVVRSLKGKSSGVSPLVVCTTVNSEGARYNLPHFLSSLQELQPPLIDRTIVVAVDNASFVMCKQLHPFTHLCVSADFGMPEVSLSPDPSNMTVFNWYFRMTFGRVYTTLRLNEIGASVLAVDVDSLFFSNPFAPGEALHSRPDAIAVVTDMDTAFNLTSHNESNQINGGFLYLPATSVKSRELSHTLLVRLWSCNCFVERINSEQVIITRLLRAIYAEAMLEGRESVPEVNVLPTRQYLNLCNTNCGSAFLFRGVRSRHDIHRMVNMYGHSREFGEQCGTPVRRRWVFVHAACLKMQFDGMASSEVAVNKGLLQQAVYKWLRE